MTINLPINRRTVVLALGAESAGVFAVYKNGDVFISENFGDLLDEGDFLKYKKAVLAYLRKEKIVPSVILTDLHPLFRSTTFGSELAKKFSAQGGSATGGKVTKHIKIQHHIAHIFSAVGDFILNTKYEIPDTFFGIAMDGTGYGLDENIWGGEAFQIKNVKIKMKNDNVKLKINKTQNLEITRIGSLEEQIMIGGDLAVREPARILIAILAKIINQELRIKNKKARIAELKNDVYKFVKKYYTKNEFELLYNQMEQDFNCQKTTSTGRVLDAVSVLLGFAGNERNFKHEATILLEKNSSNPYDIKPVLALEKKNKNEIKNQKSKIKMTMQNSKFTLQTIPLFEYLIRNIHKDKRRLAATAQLYIAKGLYKIIQLQTTNYKLQTVFAAGGMANNKIISSYLEKQNIYLSKKIPRGDEGIAIGQIVYYLLNKIRNPNPKTKF